MASFSVVSSSGCPGLAVCRASGTITENALKHVCMMTSMLATKPSPDVDVRG